MKLSIYLVSKPLQYFNATNVVDDNHSKICIIINNFHRCEDFYLKVRGMKDLWMDVLLFEESKDAYNWIKCKRDIIDTLFIDSDYGLQKNVWLYPLRKLNIFVYEEGLGTYTNNRRGMNFIAKSINVLFRTFLGLNDFIGGSPLIKGIILYDIELHRRIYPNFKKNRVRFKQSFAAHLIDFANLDLFLDQDTKNSLQQFKGLDVVVYMTSWYYRNSIESVLINYSGYSQILKPHPHIKEDLNQYKSRYDFIVPNQIMSEFFIVYLFKICKDLIIIHENSSSFQYLFNLDVTLIDLTKNTTFDQN